MMKYLYIFLLCSTQAISQYWQKIDSIFAPMGVSAQNFSAPFFADMNRDGKPDLFMGSTGNRVDYFTCLQGTPEMMYRRDTNMLSAVYANGYQFTNADYPVLADIDGDKDLDLVISGYNGLLYYENVGDTTYARWQKSDTMFAYINTLIGSDAKPCFVDIDNDGDFDLYVGIGESLLGGPTPGITMAFRNTGTRYAPSFVYAAPLSSGIMDVGRNAYHTFADLDNDGDYDMLIGRDLATFVYYKNVGNAIEPVWQNTSTLFSGVETTHYWKDPVLFDIDKDGDFDLIYGTDSGLLYVYENTGTAANPAFTYKASYFRIVKLDANAATVSFADYDNDDDYDFISGSWLGKIAYFQNSGTKTKPQFTLTAMPFSNLTTGSYSSPVFVDLDNDGDQDIVSGNLSGKLTLFVNTNGSFSTNTTYFAFVNVAGGSVPAFADLDLDGDQDLLVGADNAANVVFYRNDGNGVFIADPTFIAGVSFPSYSRPHFCDIDKDGDKDLLIGRSNGSIVYYENTGTALAPSWTRNDSVCATIKVNQNASPALADLDNDGRPDMVVGEYNGGFTYYKNLFAVADIEQKSDILPSGFSLSQNFPNPFNPSTTITFAIPAGGAYGLTSLLVYDALGSEVAVLAEGNFSAGVYEVEFNPNRINNHPLASGMYFYRLQCGAFTETKKMLYLR